jgi:hypothetical protein
MLPMGGEMSFKGSSQMTVSKIVTSAVAALSLLGVSTVASAAPAASKLAVSAPARAGAKVAKKNEAIGTGVIIAVLAAAAVVAGIVIAADNNDSPTSA